ncbi:mannose-6-phosphate isomerase, class I [Pollutibacter soli]|uniref:mannose-6-phosphate isomerase, class I n=1 Tax=Pollutibacter soli TaxID=3034157 RepID=UPI003013C137
MQPLKGKIQHYAWGGTDFIPSLLSIENTDHKPFAEYWLGTHPGGVSRIGLTENESVSLADAIKKDPAKWLGEKVNNYFGELPYLLKILDVKDMLSIQVHPTKTEAEKGFDREEALGIPQSAAHRNYKDRNHKPEVMVALSDFWLLHGFSPNLHYILENSEWFNTLLPIFEAKGIEGLYQFVMELPQEGVDKLLQPLAQKIVPLYEAGQLSKSSPDFWAGRVLVNSKPDFKNLDRGIFSIYFFNIVQLARGEGIFQAAGVPHAYMEGQNMELMSNSDNVLRAGLTPKYIDVPELLKHTIFEYTHPRIIEGEVNGHVKKYPCPVPDFVIYHTSLKAGEFLRGATQGPEIVILLNGKANWHSGDTWIHIEKGHSLFFPAGENYEVRADGDCEWFTAAVPVEKL